MVLYTSAHPPLALRPPVHPSKLVLPAQRSFCLLWVSSPSVSAGLGHGWFTSKGQISLTPTLKPRVPSTEIFMTERTHSETSLGTEPNRGGELWTESHMKGLCVNIRTHLCRSNLLKRDLMMMTRGRRVTKWPEKCKELAAVDLCGLTVQHLVMMSNNLLRKSSLSGAK